ncbi:hypothetical protein PR048_014354 [Dryococelus australis]|uniref:CCHC-type domain-containing protein n=1 Tax=Dryococelus australis TaxID=614101 RepID=A0ABQ9HE01_9NEOP|nr:hypothetical protein PR048_014354 [Dryococelus australis]
MDILEGTLQEPEALKIDATPAVVTLFNSNVERFLKAKGNALLILTTNMTGDTLEKVMRCSTACKVWMELHRMFDSVSEDKVYDLLINKSERTIENLTNQFCTFEKASKSRTADLGQEALSTTSRKVSDKPIGKEAKHVTCMSTFLCYYCKKPGHIVRNCRNWVEDSKPQLSRGKSEGSELYESVGAVESLMAATASLASDDDDQGQYIEYGTTDNVTNQRDVFTKFENFNVTHSV